MLRSNNNWPTDYQNFQQMAVQGDVLKDFVIIFRDVMTRVRTA